MHGRTRHPALPLSGSAWELAGWPATPPPPAPASPAGRWRCSAPSTRTTGGSPHRARRARRPAAADGAPAGRRAGRLGRADPHAARASTSIGRRLWDLGLLAPVQTGLRRAGLAVPPRPLRRDAGHRAPRGARRHRGALPRPARAAHASVPIVSTIGSRLPMHATGVGKVLLAHAPADGAGARCWRDLTRVTPYTDHPAGHCCAASSRGCCRDDYATTVEEMSLGACSVAVPVRQRRRRRGRARASWCPACAATGPRLVAALQVAARGIGRLLPDGEAVPG